MKIIFGGWYQRTTLHLSEIYDLFALGHSNLPLSSEKLSEFKENFGFKSVIRTPGYLECVEARTLHGIVVRYYEDGLYTLEFDSTDILNSQKILEHYFENNISPAISYIFSLGAPTPKVVANIKTEHPTVVIDQVKNLEDYKFDTLKFGEVYSKIVSGNFAVYKAPKFIFVISNHKKPEILSNLVEMQIFFREFKDQLEKYLNIHRNIWEEISALKEKKQIKGSEINKYRVLLEQYLTTINLISNRINQMGSYIKTRQSIAKELELETSLTKLFQYKFDSLNDTLGYIKEIWKMTSDYTENSLKLLGDLENNSLNNSIKSLQVITSIGVVSGVLGYLTKDALPTPTYKGVIFFAILVILSIAVNFIITLVYKNLKYKIKFSERKEDI
ncbi:MAG: hypothetical protein HYV90_03745 [Candidatus Woesebacteria bacterium]|nr:MAG: hypothetical protein HYV90_03745 [Candidatus Woesebacteria bacterium]